MVNKSFYTWYKKVNKIVSDNIEKINLCNFSIHVQLSHHEILDNTVKTIYITVYNLADGKCEIMFNGEIATYFIDKVNKETLCEFKKFLENLSENTQN